jgi:hypothetical protein
MVRRNSEAVKNLCPLCNYNKRLYKQVFSIYNQGVRQSDVYEPYDTGFDHGHTAIHNHTEFFISAGKSQKQLYRNAK